MWLAQAYEPDRPGRVRLPVSDAHAPCAIQPRHPGSWCQEEVNKQMTITLLLLLGSDGFLFKIGTRGKTNGISWQRCWGVGCRCLRAWGSALPQAMWPLLSFPWLLTYPGFSQQRGHIARWPVGIQKWCHEVDYCIQVQYPVIPCDVGCNTDIYGERWKSGRRKLCSLGVKEGSTAKVTFT